MAKNVKPGVPKAIKSSAEGRPGLIFIAQRLYELTHHNSLDSYRSPAVHIPVLITEAISQLEAIRDEDFGISPSSARPILSELSTRLKESVVVKAIVPTDRKILHALQSANWTEVIAKLKVLRREISQPAYVAQSMTLLIEAARQNNKSTLEALCKDLITALENAGMGRRHLHESTDEFFFIREPHIESPDALRAFLQIIFPHYHEFTSLFKTKSVIGNISRETFAAFDIEILKEVPEKFKEAASGSEFENLSDDENYLLVSRIRAFDRYSAADEAANRIGRLQNLYRMYNHREKFSLITSVLIDQCCASGVKLMSRERTRMSFVNDDRPQKAAQKLEFMLKSSKLASGSDKTKFYSVAEFHGMTLDSKSVENQILNLWISLETIAPPRKGLSKIDSVAKALLPVVGVNYIRRIASRVTFDLLRWNRPFVSKLLRSIDDNPSNEPTLKVLKLLALPTSTSALTTLFTELGDHELLRNRLFRLQQTFHKPKSTEAFILDHQQRVDWQIRRIYRTRNTIVHMGQTPSYADTIVDNAHDYFDQMLLTTSAVSCGVNGLTNYTEAFDYIEWEFETYLRRISEMGNPDDATVSNYIWRRRDLPSRNEILGIST